MQIFLYKYKHIGRKCSNPLQCAFKGNKGKERLVVQWQIFNFISFFPQKRLSVNSFQKLNLYIIFFTAKIQVFQFSKVIWIHIPFIRNHLKVNRVLVCLKIKELLEP